MPKINLNKLDIYDAIWKTSITLLLLLNMWLTLMTGSYIDVAKNSINSNIDNVFRKLSSFETLQPGIPDANNNSYQESCPAESSILDDPNRIVKFFEVVDPYIEAKPYRLNLLIALLVGDRDKASNYLLEEYSTGFPIR